MYPLPKVDFLSFSHSTAPFWLLLLYFSAISLVRILQTTFSKYCLASGISVNRVKSNKIADPMAEAQISLQPAHAKPCLCRPGEAV